MRRGGQTSELENFWKVKEGFLPYTRDFSFLTPIAGKHQTFPDFNPPSSFFIIDSCYSTLFHSRCK